MKVTINLTDTEVKALKSYLREVSSDIDAEIGKKEIEEEVKGMVNSSIQFGALGEHYKKYHY